MEQVERNTNATLSKYTVLGAAKGRPLVGRYTP